MLIFKIHSNNILSLLFFGFHIEIKFDRLRQFLFYHSLAPFLHVSFLL